jgi:three-Cys-motif partner protein
MDNPVKPDDADEKWEGYPKHTRAKHDLLKYYIDIWCKILGASGDKLRIFDCFAGRGEYDLKDGQEPISLTNITSPADCPGSPQLLLDTVVGRVDNISEVECIFIEKERKNAELLKENLPDKSSLPNNIKYRVEQGEFQTQTPNLVNETGGWSLPSFFFIDPFGYSPLDYDVVTQLGSQSRFEIFVNLMASQVVRWEDADKHHNALTNLFGTKDWHSELEEFAPEHWNDREVSYYCHRLEKNGPEYTRAYLVTEEDTRRMKYYLVFGTNNTKGVEKMHSSMKRCGIGEFAYAPNRTELHEEQRGLGTFTEKQRTQKIKQDLLGDFTGMSLSFDDLCEKFVTENEYHFSQRKDIRKATKQLENEKRISVTRITSKTERGLGGDDIVSFSK